MKESKEERKEVLIPKQRRDSKKNLLKVAKIVLKNPDATQREIAKAANIGLGTVNRQVEHLEHVKSPFIEEVLRADEEIIKLAQSAIKAKLEDQEYLKTLRPAEISSVAKDSTGRFALFRGGVTDNEGGLKLSEIEQLSDEELFSRLQKRGQV